GPERGRAGRGIAGPAACPRGMPEPRAGAPRPALEPGRARLGSRSGRWVECSPGDVPVGKIASNISESNAGRWTYGGGERVGRYEDLIADGDDDVIAVRPRDIRVAGTWKWGEDAPCAPTIPTLPQVLAAADIHDPPGTRVGGDRSKITGRVSGGPPRRYVGREGRSVIGRTKNLGARGSIVESARGVHLTGDSGIVGNVPAVSAAGGDPA